jgi:uncharacterized tellurite resistance protein B-like protein
MPDKFENLTKPWEASMSDGQLHRLESMMRARVARELQLSEADIARARHATGAK